MEEVWRGIVSHLNTYIYIDLYIYRINIYLCDKNYSEFLNSNGANVAYIFKRTFADGRLQGDEMNIDFRIYRRQDNENGNGAITMTLVVVCFIICVYTSCLCCQDETIFRQATHGCQCQLLWACLPHVWHVIPQTNIQCVVLSIIPPLYASERCGLYYICIICCRRVCAVLMIIMS